MAECLGLVQICTGPGLNILSFRHFLGQLLPLVYNTFSYETITPHSSRNLTPAPEPPCFCRRLCPLSQPHIFSTMAPTRQQRAHQKRVLQAARLAAYNSRPRPKSPADALVTDSSLSEGPAISPIGKSYNWPRAPRPNIRCASVVGIGCDMIFAPVGTFIGPVQV